MSQDIVLCYHALSFSWDADLSTTPDRFMRQIRLLLKRGYAGVRFTDAVHSSGTAKLFAVTFDDGYRSVIELALPVLSRLSIPATVFLPTDFVGTERPMQWPGIDHWLDGPFERELIPMSWSEIQSLASAGWEIGSHSGSHPYLTRLSEGALDDELARSKAACERHLQATCESLAYPYGDVDTRVIAAAAKAGYKTAAALPDKLYSRDPMAWPRIGVYRVDDDLRFRLKTSTMLRRLRGSAAWDAVTLARRLPAR